MHTELIIIIGILICYIIIRIDTMTRPRRFIRRAITLLFINNA